MKVLREFRQQSCQCGKVIRANCDRVRCPACKSWVLLGEQSREELKTKIQKRVADKHRLTNWIAFFRHADEPGLGTTTFRLIRAAQHKKELRAMLKAFLRVCSCQTDVAIGKLNEAHPY